MSFFIFQKLYLIHSCCIAKILEKKRFLEFKVEVVCQMLSSTNITIAAPQLFDRHKGHHFPSEIPPTEKKGLKNVVLSVIQKKVEKKVNITVIMVSKNQDCAQHPASCCTISQSIIVNLKCIIWLYNNEVYLYVFP